MGLDTRVGLAIELPRCRARHELNLQAARKAPAPAHGGKKQLALTIQSSLTFNSDSTYTYTFKAKGSRSKADKAVANGVTIKSGAAQGTLTRGTVLTVIKNTAATPIDGNLPNGAIVTVNGNNLQASYSGDDGNDLTLTVVP